MEQVEELEQWLTRNDVRYWREEFHDGCEIHILPEQRQASLYKVNPLKTMLSILFDRSGSPYVVNEHEYDDGK